MALQQGVTISGLVVEYHRGGYPIRPLDEFEMHVEPGQLALLLGPSGCGKTTLLSCLAGIQEPTSGHIMVDDLDVTALSSAQLTDYRRNTVGVVFQAFNLVPSLSAAENIMVPLRASGVGKRQAAARAHELLHEVGLGDRGGHRPGSLSGGQMQRVAIARALVLDPPLVLADEPTANLDHVQVEVVLRILRGLTRRGRTVIVSTHDQRLLALADQVIELSPEHAHDMTPMIIVNVDPGEELFAEGSEGTRIYRVDDGAIELTRGDEHLHTAQVGEVFGEMSPLFNLPRSARAVAARHSTLSAWTVDGFTAEFGGEELRRLVSRFEED
jgi:putative ABC transport system ATP-binding protein